MKAAFRNFIEQYPFMLKQLYYDLLEFAVSTKTNKIIFTILFLAAFFFIICFFGIVGF